MHLEAFHQFGRVSSLVKALKSVKKLCEGLDEMEIRVSSICLKILTIS